MFLYPVARMEVLRFGKFYVTTLDSPDYRRLKSFRFSNRTFWQHGLTLLGIIIHEKIDKSGRTVPGIRCRVVNGVIFFLARKIVYRPVVMHMVL